MSERPPQRRILPPLPGLFGAVFAFIVLAQMRPDVGQWLASHGKRLKPFEELG